jgi:hypothetical protein
VVPLVAAIPIQRGQDGTLVGPGARLGSRGPDRVQEGKRRRAGPQQPHPGVGVDPVLVRDLLHDQRLEVVGMQVHRDVLVIAEQQDVSIQP